METPFAPVEIFYSFAEADAPLLEQLERHLSVLRQEGSISTWHKRQIAAGSDWQVEIDHHLNTASLILLLVSPDFLASNYQYGVELQRAVERHSENEARVIPILLRPCDWKSAPFAKLQMLPRNGKALSMWRNRDAGFTEIAKELRTILQILPSSPFSIPSSKYRLWNVPYQRNPYFTGRDELLEQLHQYFALTELTDNGENRCVALTQPHAIKGLGGIGKTQVAVEYAYRSRDLGRYTHTLWINAINEETISASFMSIANLIPSLATHTEKDQRKIVEAVKRWLEQCKQRWLLIFDNADEMTLVRDYLPQAGNGSILLTTRAHAVGSLATSVEVETMGFVEGTQLLLRRAQRFEQASDEEINHAGNIVVALDHFPLALDQAGAYIEETQCSLGEYLHLYETHRQALLAQRGIQATDYPDSVATTWLLSFQKVQQSNPATAELLHLCSFLAPDRIPEELFRDGAAHWPLLLRKTVVDPLRLQQLIADLLKYSLVKRLVEERTLSIHRLVQAVQRDRMALKMQRQWAKRIVQALNVVFPENPQELAAWPQCLRYLEQAQACYMLIEHYELAFVEAASVLGRTGLYLEDHALYAIAEPLYQRALTIDTRTYGDKHPTVATDLYNLADLYRTQGKYKQAEPLLEQALSIYEQQLGPVHLDTANGLNGLAVLYDTQGKYKQAEPLYQRALSIYEQQLGPVHPDAAGPLNNLADLYQTQGKYEQAESFYQRALSIYEQQLGPVHPLTATGLSNLANLYLTQGSYEQAELLYQRALAIDTRVYGDEHPTVATDLHGLAVLYDTQGKYEQAEPLYQRALSIYEQQFGSVHPDTANCLHLLADLYRTQGRYEQAQPLLEQAISIYERKFGSEHPSTANCLNSLAILYDTQGKYEQAEPLYQRALSIYEQQLGLEHPDTASTLNNLADLYRTQERYEQAELFYQRALSIYEQQLGLEHPDTANSLHHLAILYDTQGKYEQAESFYQRALSIYEQQFGPEHPETVSTLNDLADLYRTQGRYEQAESL